MTRLRPNDKNLNTFLQQQTEQAQPFELLHGLTAWLRRNKGRRAPQRFTLLLDTLRGNPALCAAIAELLCGWLGSMRIYPLLISNGIFSRGGFRSELSHRLYERLNPSYKDRSDLRDVFALLFRKPADTLWLAAVPLRDWLSLLELLRAAASEPARTKLHNYMRTEGLYAVEMLSVWIAAEALQPDLIRLDPKLLDVDSPFVALKREVSQWLRARHAERPFDAAHLNVMLEQCRQQIERLRKKGTGAGAGSSMGVAHLLERLEQTLNRLILLMDLFAAERLRPNRLLQLTATMAQGAAEQNTVAPLWKRSVKMLSRSITQNTSSHGEHYITRTRSEYWAMFYSAAGAGVLIALMSLFKIHLGHVIRTPFWLSLAEGLNYGLGFALIHILHMTVATKQPAMTASSFAEAVESNQGKTVDAKLAQLLVDVIRSQSIAVFGNVAIALTVAGLIGAGFAAFSGSPLLDAHGVAYQLKAIDPTRPTLWFAAIAGVWLFCSGIIAGFLDNRCDYLNLRMRLREHPLLKRLLPGGIRGKFADYMHAHYGAIMGNICFGLLLGMTGFVGHALNLPLDIRHIAFSSANLGYAAVSGGFPWHEFAKNLIFVLLIGLVNLWVSFSITLWVALRSRETRIESWFGILRHLWQIARDKPSSLFMPPKDGSGGKQEPH